MSVMSVVIGGGIIDEVLDQFRSTFELGMRGIDVGVNDV